MTVNDTFYEGRRQSEVKHKVLQQYLRDMSFKIAKQYSSLNFVDGYSGPWQSADKQYYSDTSFAQSIETLQNVQKTLSQKFELSFPVKFVFCEKDPKRHKELSEFASQKTDVEIHCLNGEFENLIPEITEICSSGFTFTFIDPTGFKLRTKEIAAFLSSQKGEFLWNYMSDHINRFARKEDLRDTFGNLLADDKWFSEFQSYSNLGYTNEEAIFHLLRERLRELGCARYLLDFPIFRTKTNRFQFRLIFGTRNKHGVTTFRKAQKDTDKYQTTKRLGARADPDQAGLFDVREHVEIIHENTGIDGQEAVKQAKVRILSFLKNRNPEPFVNIVAPILETELLTLPRLKACLVELKQSGEIDFNLAVGKRLPQDSTLIKLKSQT